MGDQNDRHHHISKIYIFFKEDFEGRLVINKKKKFSFGPGVAAQANQTITASLITY